MLKRKRVEIKELLTLRPAELVKPDMNYAEQCEHGRSMHRVSNHYPKTEAATEV
jgi:hypothetical protein